MSARIAKAISPCRRSGMPRCVAMPATIQRRRGAPVLVGSVKSRCRRTRNRPGVMSVGKGGDQRVVDEAGIEASLPTLPLCIWCGAALDGGPSSDAGRPCVRSTAERPSTGRCLKVSTHRPSCVSSMGSLSRCLTGACALCGVLIGALRAYCVGQLARRKRRGLSVPLANVGGCFFCC